MSDSAYTEEDTKGKEEVMREEGDAEQRVKAARCP